MKKTRVAEGLYEVVAESGSGYYVTRFKVNGKSYERGLGSIKDVTLKEAKLLAAKARLDFKEEKQEEAEHKLTFGEVMDDAIAGTATVRMWKNQKSRANMESRLRNYALPALKNKPIDEITRHDIKKILEPIWFDKTHTGARVREALENVFTWCIANDKMEGMNPAVWRGNMSAFFPAPKKVKPVKHHEAPTIEELRYLVAYLRERPSRVNAAILFGIATPLRSHEYCEAKRDEIKGDTWIMPFDRRKIACEDPFRVPLNSLALEALAMVRGENPDNWFFPSPEAGVSHVCNQNFPSKLSKILGRRVTMHGIRSAFRDWAAEEDIREDVAEKSLMHAYGNETQRSYYRTDLLEKRRKVAQEWANLIAPRR